MNRITRKENVRADKAARDAVIREQVKKDFPPLNDEIKVGDKVAVQDQRDGAIVAYTKVRAMGGDGYVSVEAGFGVSLRCLLKIPPETLGHEWEWLPIARGSCVGSWRCKHCLTAYDIGCGRDMQCDKGEPYRKK